MYDIIIIGAGPAGLTAAIYAQRAGKQTLLIEKSTFGGQMTFSPKIENYPGFEAVSGNELADKMVSQALGLGAEVEFAAVTGIEEAEENGKRFFLVRTADGEAFAGRSVILAAGAEHRRLGLPGEEELIGHGISFCAVCDGAFYAGQDIAVVGGGNSAIVEASLLAETAKSVTMIQNLSDLTGEKVTADALRARENVRIICDTVVDAYLSEGGELTGVRMRNTVTGEKREERFAGVFIAIGLKPANGAFENFVDLDRWGYAAADERCTTRTEGIFVAGDCRTKAVRQVSTAAADGAVAALAACAWIDRA